MSFLINTASLVHIVVESQRVNLRFIKEIEESRTLK